MHDPYDDFNAREIAFERAENIDLTQPTTHASKTPFTGVYARLRAVDELLQSQRESAAAARELDALLNARMAANNRVWWSLHLKTVYPPRLRWDDMEVEDDGE